VQKQQKQQLPLNRRSSLKVNNHISQQQAVNLWPSATGTSSTLLAAKAAAAAILLSPSHIKPVLTSDHTAPQAEDP
jgi:hypothetical protein